MTYNFFKGKTTVFNALRVLLQMARIILYLLSFPFLFYTFLFVLQIYCKWRF